MDIEDVLNALDGVAYWTDLDGRLKGVGERGWNEAARSAGLEAPPEGVIGRNLFEVIEGEEVREVYRSLTRLVIDKGWPRLTFAYRCDAPDIRREMRMTLGLLTEAGRPMGVVYHSQVIREEQRPPLGLLAPIDAAKSMLADRRPILAICSFCHDVRSPHWPEWLSCEDYYHRGGKSDVRLSHGVCPGCAETLNPEVEVGGSPATVRN